jgi:hypothetical protein
MLVSKTRCQVFFVCQFLVILPVRGLGGFPTLCLSLPLIFAEQNGLPENRPNIKEP